MAKYICKNCAFLKTRVIHKKDIPHISRKKMREAIRRHTLAELELPFPINFIVYKGVMRYGECKIIYCSENMLGREVYVHKNNLEKIGPMSTKCPGYM